MPPILSSLGHSDENISNITSFNNENEIPIYDESTIEATWQQPQKRHNQICWNILLMSILVLYGEAYLMIKPHNKTKEEYLLDLLYILP